MDRKDLKYKIYVAILEEELIRAIGCTEPIAIAYAAAKCREVLGEIPERVCIRASGSIIKNAKSAIVPNTGNLRGIRTAISAGIIAGDSNQKLEVISSVTEKQRSAIKDFLKNTTIEVMFLNQGHCFELVVEEWMNDGRSASVQIMDYHTNIVKIEKNGQKVFDSQGITKNKISHKNRSILNMHDIFEFADTCDINDVKEIIKDQISCNMAIAQEGMTGKYGANIGNVWLDAYGKSIENQAVAMAAAGSDARMGGCNLPVVVNSGSGNQGITCSVPVIAYAKAINVGEEKLLRALVLSNLIAIYQKNGIGTLSAFCGAVSAGVAAGAGVAYLKGGKEQEILHTVVNALAIASGMICDGAKSSCAAKIAVAVQTGLLGYDMYIRGQQFYAGDGIVTKGADETIANIARIGREGMRKTNEEIVEIMIK